MEEDRLNNQKIVDDLLEKNGLKPINLEQTERRIGNTERSDYEFNEQLKDADYQKKKLDNAAYADPEDLGETLLNASEASEKRDKDPYLEEYMNSSMPTNDYTDSYPQEKDTPNEPGDQIDELKEIVESGNIIDTHNDTIDELGERLIVGEAGNENDVPNEKIDKLEELSDVVETDDANDIPNDTVDQLKDRSEVIDMENSNDNPTESIEPVDGNVENFSESERKDIDSKSDF